MKRWRALAAVAALGAGGCNQPEAAATAISPPPKAEAPHPEPAADKPPACVPEPLAEEERVVLGRLRQRRLEIEARAGELDRREQEIKTIERAATALLDRVEQIKNRIEARLGVGRGSDEARAAQVAKLGETLRTMKPKQAAELISGLGPETARPLLNSLGAPDVAKLLAALRPDKAAELAALLVDAPGAPSPAPPPATAPAPTVEKEGAHDQGS